MTILYVQHDYAVFGFGDTRHEAIAMAAQWLKDETGKQGCSVEYVTLSHGLKMNSETLVNQFPTLTIFSIHFYQHIHK